MSKLASLLLFLIIFIPKTAFAQTISNIRDMSVGIPRSVTVSSLAPNTSYYWEETRSGSNFKYSDCFNSGDNGVITRNIGPYDEPGQYLLQIIKSYVGSCTPLTGERITSQSFNVTGTAIQNPFNPDKSCSEQGIANPQPPVKVGNNYLLFFTLNNTALNQLQGREVRLHFGIGPGSFNTNSVTLGSSNNALALEDPRMKTIGSHEAVLDLNLGPVQGFQQMCKEVKYVINTPVSPSACRIDLSNLPSGQAPPNSVFSFQFSGDTNTEYKLSILNSSLPSSFNNPNSNVQFTQTTITDGTGRGIFLVTPLAGKQGDKLTLKVAKNPEGSPFCSSDPITLDLNAPIPGPLPDTPPPTIAPGSTVDPDGKIIGPNGLKCPGDPKCSTAGGISCDKDTNNPGISTAIGCIHTNPVSFVKDFLKFAVGIAGGLAFLMMLLGAFQMVTSAGNPDTLSAGRERFKDAIIGLLFVIFATLLLQILGVGILAIPGFK